MAKNIEDSTKRIDRYNDFLTFIKMLQYSLQLNTDSRPVIKNETTRVRDVIMASLLRNSLSICELTIIVLVKKLCLRTYTL